MTRVDPRDLAYAGAAEQARLLASGAIKAPELLENYLDRINRIDPELRSYRVILADSARREAAAAQDRLDAGERLPLLGVPIAIKDDVDVEGEVTTYGSSAYGPAAAADSEVVRRLREAGAVILGKTCVPELMIWPFTLTFGQRGPARLVRSLHGYHAQFFGNRVAGREELRGAGHRQS